MVTTAAKLKSPNSCCYLLLELHTCFPESPYICRKLNVNNPILRCYNLNVPWFKVYIILLHPLKTPYFPAHHAAEIPRAPGHMSTDTAREISLMPSKCSAGNILRRRMRRRPGNFVRIKGDHGEMMLGKWWKNRWKMVEKSLENVEK